ncbi:dolichol kinase EVAN [Silene latifolia]|uniref:dolichol kinase EVAN n=1 Tax=Silene latifolia TaxID=37657 RepID=UPI003D7760CA
MIPNSPSTMASLFSLLNGERAVVFFLLTRILYSVPFTSLFFESIALSFLAVVALFVEISLENSPSLITFRTRPGASSGTLLGAVTLPALMLSKLIQLSRGLALGQVAATDFQYEKLLYWAAYMSCFSVLLFVGHFVQQLRRSNLVVKLGFASAVLSALGYIVLQLGDSYSGLHLVMLVFWMLGHGVAAIKLIQHIFCSFPSCASIGEGLLVTVGLTTYAGDMLRSTLMKIMRHFISSDAVSVEYIIKRSEISTIIQVYLLGLLLFPLILRFCLQVVDRYTRSSFRIQSESGKSILFFTLLVISSTAVIPLWAQFVHDFQVHPLLWVLSFVFSEPFKRLSLCMYWVGVICVSVHRFYDISKGSKVERILLRKYYHLMAVAMFVPALILQPNFLNLAFGAALAVFLVLEIIRVWRIWPLGEMIHGFMNAFTDHRDSDLLVVSHFSLLLGCALPMWMSSGFNDRPLAPFAGILSLGIGDTMASMVGHKYGVLRWSKTGKKTIEGTAAGITSVMAACSFLLPLLASTGYIQNWSSLIVAVIASGLLEAYTAQLDNAFIPLAFYSLLCL